MKNVLFLVTGKTTPIITETVWALACNPEEPEPWIPDEIHVLSTEEGLDHIRMELFDNNGSPVFDQFKKDYPQLKDVYFNGEDCLHVFQDENGNKLSDLRTPKDNEIAADLICQKVREFTDDDNTSLHVSIAGGRKTMGFYAGYALSLYGRAQDSMSHVLVEEKFENAEGFFYPTPKDLNIIIKNRAGKPVRTSEAQVWLASIPFVRLRQQLTDEALISNLSFTEVVDFINAANETPKVAIYDNADRYVVVNNKKVKLSPKEFSLYLLVAELNTNNQGLVYPSKEIEGDSINESAQARYDDIYDKHKTKSGKAKVVMDYDNFGQTVSKIATKLKKGFGTAIGEKVAIQKLDNGKYGLKLPTENVFIGK